MIKNYFTIAFRNFLRNKLFSLINVLGLSIGISASLVIYLLVDYDFSFEKFEKDRDRIYRIVSAFRFSGDKFYNSGVPDPMANAARKEISGLSAIVPFHLPNFEVKVSVPTETASKRAIFKKQENIIFADQEYFKLLSYRWLAGSPERAVAEPYKVVLTESRAKLYFSHLPVTSVIGKEIVYNDSIRATVAGIVRDLGQNTDFAFKEFISLVTIPSSGLKYNYSWDQWNSTNSSSQLFVKLSEGTKVAQIETQLKALMKKYNKDQKQDNLNSAAFLLQPLSDLHFNANYDAFDRRLAHMPTLYGLLIVASFLLLLGCINFINLTTAQASQRAKEIGIRKTMGSSRRLIVLQFLNETMLLTAFASVLSLIMTPVLLAVFSDFVPKELHFNLFQEPQLLTFLLVLVILVSVLAGFYPAWVLSRYQPVQVLKNQIYSQGGKTRKAWFRKTLTITQFAIAEVFIMATILVGKQINFSIHKDLGFKKEAIIFFSTNYYDTAAYHRRALMDKLRDIPEISLISRGNSPPSSPNTWSSTMKYKDGKKETENDVQVKFGDTNYIKLYQMKLLAGHNLQYSDTVNSLIINETYSKTLGFRDPQKAIGKFIDWNKQVPIVGVVADFHQHSLHEPIKPLIISNGENQERLFSVALQPQNADGSVWKSAISKMQKAWKEIYPEDEFDYSFFDETIAKYYKSEQDISRLLTWATGLAIFISCLGLLGLVIYTTATRTKEIGVRKVLGASVSQIVRILSKEFIRLVLIAFVIATPLAWWAMYSWLQNFAYRTSISWWIFAMSGLLLLALAIITLSVQTVRAAVANPVNSLRSE